MQPTAIKLGRRNFLTMAALGAIATYIAASCRQAREGDAPVLAFDPQFSGEITRLAIIHDAAALELQDPTQPEQMRRALMGTPGLPPILSMGALFPAGASVIDFLAEARRQWFDFDKSNDDHRVAIATGYLMHRTIETRLREGSTALGIGADEVATAIMQQDAEVIRSLLTTVPPTVNDVERLLLVLDRRLRIQIHTLRPDATDEAAWVMQILAWDAAQNEVRQQLAEAIVNPNAQACARYVDALNFFDRGSPLVRAARNRSGAELVAVSTPEKSLYGLALQDCTRLIGLVRQFIDGSISTGALHQAIDPITST